MGDAEVESLLRRTAPQALGALVRRYGHFDTAEDAVQEALLAAATQWPRDGVPDDPRAWLITVAARRLTDLLRAEQARRRQIDLQPCRHEAHGARRPYPHQPVGKADSLGDGNALRLHANRAVGDDPGLVGACLAALGDQGRGALGGGPGLGTFETSGTENAQFLFDSFAGRT